MGNQFAFSVSTKSLLPNIVKIMKMPIKDLLRWIFSSPKKVKNIVWNTNLSLMPHILWGKHAMSLRSFPQWGHANAQNTGGPRLVGKDH